jgi:hypothetical protein
MLHDLLDANQGQLGFCNFESLDHVLDCAVDLHDAVCLAIDILESARFYDRDILKTFRAIEKTLSNSHESVDIGRSANYDLSKALNDMSELVCHVQGSRPKSNPMRQAFAHSIPILERYVSRTHKDLADIEAELVEAIYQVAGAVIGTCMARYICSHSNHRLSERETELDGFLTRGDQ